MLRERMNTDYDVWAPPFKKFRYVSDTPFMKKLTRIRANAVYEPIVILHPLLPVTQDPVVQTHHFLSKMVRFLYRPHDPDGIRLTVKKLLQTSDNRRGRGAMPTARIRRDDQDLGIARRQGHL